MKSALKKSILAVGLLAAVGLTADENRCQSCEQKLAIKQEIQDILAQALALAQSGAVEEIVEKCGCGKPRPPRPSRKDEEIIVAEEQEEQEVTAEKCGCGKPKPAPRPIQRPSGRADKDAQMQVEHAEQSEENLVDALKKALGSIKNYLQQPCNE